MRYNFVYKKHESRSFEFESASRCLKEKDDYQACPDGYQQVCNYPGVCTTLESPHLTLICENDFKIDLFSSLSRASDGLLMVTVGRVDYCRVHSRTQEKDLCYPSRVQYLKIQKGLDFVLVAGTVPVNFLAEHPILSDRHTRVNARSGAG